MIEKTCNRCGQCCEAFFLSLSPDELEEGYYTGRHDPLIWPMVRGRLRQVFAEREPGERWYLYGPCRWFRWTADAQGQLIGECLIHEERPDMCRNFPFYGRNPAEHPNPSNYKGCSFNDDPAAGVLESGEYVGA